MLIKTTSSNNFLFQICQSGVKTGRTSLVFVKIRDKEIALWRNYDILLDVELFHAPIWAFGFP